MFDCILENNYFNHLDFDNNLKIVKEILHHINSNVFISLSGGVDSMVLTVILKKFYNIECIHINYNNRKESYLEERFLKEWCDFYGIKLHILKMEIKRENSNRNFYEKYTNKLRYDFYKRFTDKIILGHHKNDVIENVFTNVMNCKNLIDLNHLKIENIINDINVCRPLINLYKKDIIKFADDYHIPYFKDSTPSWSVRGILRNNIFPYIRNYYSNYENQRN